MSMNDVISDMVARIRNGQRAQLAKITCVYSKLAENIAKVLESEGYIRAYQVNEVRAGVNELVIELKYYEGAPVISEIKRVSKPGRRVYAPIEELARVKNGLGISILSTSKGVLCDQEARAQKVGGEVLCQVF